MARSTIVNRPVTLTIVMWVLLALSIVAAMGLVHLKGGLWRIALTEPQTIGTFELRLPVGWQIQYTQRGSAESVEATEPVAPGRSLSVHVTNIDEQIGPMDFLLNSDLVRLMMLDRNDINAEEEITVPGGQGSIIHPKRGPSIAILTFNDNRAAIIQLDSSSSSSGADDAIIYHVATSLRMVAPAPESEPQPEPQPQPQRRWIPRRGRDI